MTHPDNGNEWVTFAYTNWRGEAAQRVVLPHGVGFRSTKYHKESQWLLLAYCVDRGDFRDFALKDIVGWAVADPVVVAAKLAEVTL